MKKICFTGVLRCVHVHTRTGPEKLWEVSNLKKILPILFLKVDLPILCLIFELLFSRYLLNSDDLGTKKLDIG